MVRIYYDKDAPLEPVRARKIAIIGYGSQGRAHALNLRDSGVDVVVGLPPHSASVVRAGSEGIRVMTTLEASRWADLIMILVPDQKQKAVYEAEILPHLTSGKMLMFAHGFNVRFKRIVPPPDVDVAMIAPKAPGHRVRELFVEGSGTPALMAVHQDPTAGARNTALAYAAAIGCGRAGILETSFADETETDLFGEQAVLCGGASALVKAGFEVLVEAGYEPELAYFECLHELKLIVDLLYQGGLNYMRFSISDTAEWGDYTAGPRIVTEQTKETMRQILREIQSGEFAEKWIAEYEARLPNFQRIRERERQHPVERIGLTLRAMMQFLDPVEAPQPIPSDSAR